MSLLQSPICQFLYDIYLYLFILYRHRKYGHHFGTKVSKIGVVSSAITNEKASIFKAFYSALLFNSKNTNTIFYKRLYYCNPITKWLIEALKLLALLILNAFSFIIRAIQDPLQRRQSSTTPILYCSGFVYFQLRGCR